MGQVGITSLSATTDGTLIADDCGTRAAFEVAKWTGGLPFIEVPSNYSLAVAYENEDMQTELPPIAAPGSATVQVAFPRNAVVLGLGERDRAFMPWRVPKGAGSDQVWCGAITGQVFTTQTTGLTNVPAVLIVPHYVSHQVQLQVKGVLEGKTQLEDPNHSQRKIWANYISQKRTVHTCQICSEPPKGKDHLPIPVYFFGVNSYF